ncbi:glycogen-binding subunit 76A [Nephila pilipes]|uniref:Glycogen-binding subunit 76A n=1 Tax=Nephila pilipes TaxID=299642 RepID=A0A8X6NMX7_NEPPI|nr:glycogen-binding subunit 76A [Nephila pilipes]
MEQSEGSNTKDSCVDSPTSKDNSKIYCPVPDVKIVTDEDSSSQQPVNISDSQSNETKNGENKVKKSSVEGLKNLAPPKEPRMKRSSSLKLEKDSSETSSEKKIVRFADALGLDLADVRVYANEEEIPNIPASAIPSLGLSGETKATIELTRENYTFIPQFEQPGADAYFLEKVKQQKVCLENVIIEGLKVTGLVRILNIGYEKKVLVRYTTNDWMSLTDQSAEFVPGSSDGVTDKFKFTINPRCMTSGSKLRFVLKYEVNNEKFWDNNHEKNFVLACEVKHCPERCS